MPRPSPASVLGESNGSFTDNVAISALTTTTLNLTDGADEFYSDPPPAFWILQIFIIVGCITALFTNSLFLRVLYVARALLDWNVKILLINIIFCDLCIAVYELLKSLVLLIARNLLLHKSHLYCHWMTAPFYVFIQATFSFMLFVGLDRAYALIKTGRSAKSVTTKRCTIVIIVALLWALFISQTFCWPLFFPRRFSNDTLPDQYCAPGFRTPMHYNLVYIVCSVVAMACFVYVRCVSIDRLRDYVDRRKLLSLEERVFLARLTNLTKTMLIACPFHIISSIPIQLIMLTGTSSLGYFGWDAVMLKLVCVELPAALYAASGPVVFLWKNDVLREKSGELLHRWLHSGDTMSHTSSVCSGMEEGQLRVDHLTAAWDRGYDKSKGGRRKESMLLLSNAKE